MADSALPGAVALGPAAFGSAAFAEAAFGEACGYYVEVCRRGLRELRDSVADVAGGLDATAADYAEHEQRVCASFHRLGAAMPDPIVSGPSVAGSSVAGPDAELEPERSAAGPTPGDPVVELSTR